MAHKHLQLLLAAALLSPAALRAQAPAPVGAPPAASPASRATLVSRLSPAARAEGERLLADRDDAARAALVKGMKAPDGSGTHEFLAALLPSEPSATVRTAIVTKIAA